MHRFICLVILALFLLNCKCRAQQLTDTVITVYFDFGQFRLSPGQEEMLLTALNNKDFLVNEVSGYTDTVGTVRGNLILSEKRSRYVDGFLRRHFALKSDYQSKGYGKQNPISLIENSLNRRVEISCSFLKEMSSIPDTSKFTVLKVLNLQKIYFRPDEAILEPSSMPYLDYVAKTLSAFNNNEVFEIKGHVNWNITSIASTDSGYKKKMDQLSADRAKAIFYILVDKGISPKRMFWKGVGNREMIYPNASTDDEKRKNMRVEILILRKPNIDD